MKTKCSTCDGVYDLLGADGLRYYHVCPPLRRLRVRELDGTYSTVVPGTEGVRPVIRDVTIDRPNLRDERRVLDPVTGQPMLIAVGTGVTLVGDNTVP